MIIDVERFVVAERKYWQELDGLLQKLARDPDLRLDLAGLQMLHYLYRRACADLARLSTFAAEEEVRRYLESLVARAYGEIYEVREKTRRFSLAQWFFGTFPRTFRRHIRCFWLSLGVTLVGCAFGGLAISLDPEAKAVIMPFEHVLKDPSERVAEEERQTEDHLQGAKTYFSSYLMTHNTRVSIATLALGMTWGIGTLVSLFYNGVILGAVALDYMLAGQTRFLLGWLLPHGSVEIPAILIAGQGGFLLASALIGWDNRLSIRARLRAVTGDIVTLIGGVAILLVWAGFIEAFFSQYHEPIIPYEAKIAFGTLELGLLFFFLSRAGRADSESS